MLKLLGAVAIFCSLSWCGIHRSRWYSRRLDCLQSWRGAAVEGERMLCDLNASTPDYLERLGESAGLGAMAERCIALLRGEERMERAWHQAVQWANFPLTADELRIVYGLGGVLGRYEAEEQRRALKVAEQRFDAQIAVVREERARLSRMWSVLGISAGALAVILLY